MNLYVGNLSFDTNQSDLQTAFAAFGQVSEVRLITDRDSGRSKGFGFIEMPNRPEAEAAILGMNGKAFQNRSLTVNEAKPRESTGQRDSAPRRW